jgi:hypothetical protein
MGTILCDGKWEIKSPGNLVRHQTQAVGDQTVITMEYDNGVMMKFTMTSDGGIYIDTHHSIAVNPENRIMEIIKHN